MQSSSLEPLITEQQSLLQSLSEEVRSLHLQLDTLKSEVRQQPMLGFSDGRDYIIIERDKNVLWHRFEDDEPVPIKSKILKGYVRRVVYVDKEYPKLHVFIESDREYVLVTGFETHFARELLAAISTLKPEDFAYPVVIKPDTGNDDNKSKHRPVFCNLIHRGRTVKPGAQRNQDIHVLFKKAEAVLQGKSVTPVVSSHQREDGGSDRSISRSDVAPFSRPQAQRLSKSDYPSTAVVPELPKLSSPLSAPVTRPVHQQSVDWVAVCQDLNISSKQLKDVARSLKLPHGKLTRSQSAQLYQAVYGRYREAVG